MSDHGDNGLHDDLALVDGLIAGERLAFDELAARLVPALYRFALGRLDGDGELTRDIVQTTICKALDKLDTFRHESSLFTWLCACCRNEILMHFRRKKTAPRLLELDDESVERGLALQAEGVSPEGHLMKGELAEHVHIALDLLPPRYACALEWKYLERLSVEEIAQRLEVGAKAAESLLSRARAAFRQRFQHLTDTTLGPPAEIANAKRIARS